MQYIVKNLNADVLFDELIDGDHDEDRLTTELESILEGKKVSGCNIILKEPIEAESFNPAALDYRTIKKLFITIQ